MKKWDALTWDQILLFMTKWYHLIVLMYFIGVIYVTYANTRKYTRQVAVGEVVHDNFFKIYF